MFKKKVEAPCEMVQHDLFPLYAEGIISDMGKRVVDSHLAHCDICYERYEQIRNNLEGNHLQPFSQTTWQEDMAEPLQVPKRKGNGLGFWILFLIAAGVVVFSVLNNMGLI